MNKNNKLLLPCDETPDNCNFLLVCYLTGETFSNKNKGVNYIVFCRKGEVHLTSSLFREETLHGGDILFLPRMADCQGEILEDTDAVIHTFNNTVCRPENCILNYLYTHKKKEEGGSPTTYCCKLPAHETITLFMESICRYLTDGTEDIQLWYL